jgi:hypothetical protein
MSYFSESDIKQIENHELTLDIVNRQLRDFETGFPYSDIESAATINHGIRPMLDNNWVEHYTRNQDKYNIVKFVPASGAATRMFKDLFEYMTTGEMNKTTQLVLENLEQFAFYDDLRATLPENPSNMDIIKHLVTDAGINYGNLPKALLQFHKYDGFNRTALAEHLIEGAQYAKSNDVVNIHFTVSPEHIDGFNTHLAEIIPQYESALSVKYNITMSTQQPSTDTIAVNLDNTPFKTDDGKLLFRPAGHGALIANLNNIDADIIFIKNIDNVCPESARADTIYHKRALAGLAMQIQTQIFDYMRALDNDTADTNEIRNFIDTTLGIKTTADTNVRDILNRPLRVCGIIKNTGEPGGGPFWVRDENGLLGLQIVEPAQIAPDNIDILKRGEFFSPTDIVCMPRDYMGNRFNLLNFIDERAGFISEKSSGGRPLRAMERPGLWNGAMANWNTVFVETPLTTFTPVKVISDLIKPSHKN